jgi:F-type H+-transporting ATPase subunit a
MFSVPAHPFEVAAEKLGSFFGLTITNTVTTALLTIVPVLLLCWWASTFSVTNPSKGQLFVEYIIEYIIDVIEKVVGNATLAKDIVIMVGPLVFFLMVSNLLPIFVPFLTAITYDHIPMFRVLTSDLNLTIAISLVMTVTAHLYGVKQIGAGHHFGKFVQIMPVINGFKKGFGEGLNTIIPFFIGLLEIVSEIAKVISLSLRLFGNLFAGEILLGVILSIFAVALPVPILMLGLLVGVIQSIVYGSLVSAKMAEFAQNH